MKPKLVINLILTLLLVLGSLFVSQVQSKFSENGLYDIRLNQTEAIVIDGNNQLMAFGLSGFGTYDKPYILSNITIDGTGLGFEVSLIEIRNVNLWLLITNNSIFNSPQWGINIDNSHNIIISQNHIQDSEFDGIGVYFSSNIKVNNNTIVNSGLAGVRFEVSSENFASNNTIINSGEVGVNILDSSDYNLIEYNTIDMSGNGVSVGFDTDSSQDAGSGNLILRNNISNSVNGGIVISGDAFDSIIKENEIQLSYFGIHLAGSVDFIRFSGTQIIGNKLHDNYQVGLYIEGAENIVIKDNEITRNSAQGIWIGESTKLIIKNNRIYQNAPDSGLNLYYCSNSSISGNLIYDGLEIGLLLEYSNFNKIFSNFIFDNYDKGLSLVESNSNTVAFNNFRNNIEAIGDDGTFNDIHSNYYNENPFINDPSPASFANYDQFGEIKFTKSDLGDVLIYSLNWDFNLQNNPFMEFHYNVSYSIDLKETWSELEFGLTESAYSVNISEIPEFIVIFVRIYISDNFGFWSIFEDFPDDILIGRIVSSPVILDPEINSELKNIVTISWEESHDTLDLPIKYQVEFLFQGDDEWTIFANNLQKTNLNWDTTQFDDGEYLIKIIAIDYFDFEYVYVSPGYYTVNNTLDQQPSDNNNSGSSPPINYSNFFFPSLMLLPIIKKRNGICIPPNK